MTKCVISNRLYIKYDEKILENIKGALTYHIEKKVPGVGKNTPMQNRIETIRTYKLHPGNMVSLPRGRMDLIPETYEVVDKRAIVPVTFPEAKAPLRQDQKDILDKISGDTFINALVGWGKTFTALHLAAKLGQKTLVVTHTTMLRDQWEKEITYLFGISPGIIGSGKLDYKEHIITVANVQTLHKYATELSKEFGTIILDEAHHSPATTFTDIIDSSFAKYRIALSGTMIRKDGKHVLFSDFFGFDVHKPPQSNTLDPTIKLVKTGIHLSGGNSWASKINNLLYDHDYQQFVASLAANFILKNHSVLIIADRVEFLQNVQYHLGDTCLLVTGSTTTEEREAAKDSINSGEKMCIAGSRQIFSEGISINRLSCVILATPISNDSLLEQIIGRIMRPYENKPNPVVIDLQFSDNSSKRQNNVRLGFYMKKGWRVESY